LTPALVLAMALTLGGCGAGPTSALSPASPAPVEFTEFYADATVTGEAAAPTVVVVSKRVGDGDDGDGDEVGDGGGDAGNVAAVLPLQLRLHNRGARTVELTESTRCTVLRWTILDARGDTVQTMPNRPCAQQLATHTLPPAQTIVRVYELPLPVRRGSYTVRFTFWRYPGEHAFEMR